ncbi:hypothetical protein L0O88_02370 [Bacteroides nordii]|uniref:hypothetical protein n=1 Tax=Bacteroides nordii TaxID=291645 RepID=UPI001EDCF4BB|nr:hypothetical protein [Bacteroides nordii]MCG4767926.1 hypothetical protein [Bacteroides nordii]
MKRYNLSQIMKSAWRKFKKSNGEKTFSECLKSAWKFAKMQDSFSDDNVSKRDREFANSLNEEIRRSAKATPSKACNDLSISASAYYSSNSKGLYGAHYVGD